MTASPLPWRQLTFSQHRLKRINPIVRLNDEETKIDRYHPIPEDCADRLPTSATATSSISTWPTRPRLLPPLERVGDPD